MPAILLYLFKTIACSGVLYLYYRLALQNRIIHQWNRFFLVGAIVASIILPLISIKLNLLPAFTYSEQIQLLEVVKNDKPFEQDDIVTSSVFFNWRMIVPAGYVSVIFLFLAVVAREI